MNILWLFNAVLAKAASLWKKTYQISSNIRQSISSEWISLTTRCHCCYAQALWLTFGDQNSQNFNIFQYLEVWFTANIYISGIIRIYFEPNGGVLWRSIPLLRYPKTTLKNTNILLTDRPVLTYIALMTNRRSKGKRGEGGGSNRLIIDTTATNLPVSICDLIHKTRFSTFPKTCCESGSYRNRVGNVTL